jgi:hypothetical protein
LERAAGGVIVGLDAGLEHLHGGEVGMADRLPCFD